MSGSRLPGPVCIETQPWSILDGTSALLRTPAPAPVCAESPLFAGNTPNLAAAAPDLGFLFRQCLSPTMGLARGRLQEESLRCEVENCLRSVCQRRSEEMTQ